MNKTYTAIFIFFVFAISCTVDKGAIKPKALVSCDTITYTTSVTAVVNAKCAIPSCHVANFGSGDFTTYAGLNAKVTGGQFNNRVFVQGNMPPTYSANGPLTTTELEILRCWYNAGAPNN